MQQPCSAASTTLRRLILATVLLLLAAAFFQPALAEDTVPAGVATSFDKFTRSWMSRLEQVNQQNSRALKPEPAEGGRVRGRYTSYGPDYVREIRPTGSKATPYVGIIRYPQKVVEKEGETLQKMKEHQGVPTSEIQVTEIFRYTGGRWVY